MRSRPLLPTLRDFMSEALVKELNRGVRGRRRLRFEGGWEFGEDLQLRRYQLGNGLRIYALRDPAAPVVSYQTWFGVGSRDERPGKTGLAHMFEHLMFFGTKTRPRGEFDKALEAAGAESNASTWTDWTQYYENLPKRALPLAISLEADRMRNLVIDEDGWAKERDVVRNERSQTVDDDIYGAASEKLWAISFPKHPYGWPTIGWADDIAAYTREDCLGFYRRWYAPNNATIVVAGDFSERALLGELREAYGGISSAAVDRQDPPAPSRPRARRATLRQPTPTPKILRGYRAPGLADPRSVAVPVLRELLTGGISARLNKTLLREQELVTSVYCSAAPFRDATLLEVWCDAREGVSVDALEATLDAEIARLAEGPIGANELERAKNQLELAFLTSMETVSGKAEQVGFYDAVLGDPAAPFRRLGGYRALTVDDVQRLAREVFRPSRSATVRILPRGGR